MTLQSLILLALKASIVLSVFAIGLEFRFADATTLLRRPRLLVRSALAMNVVMPVVAAAMAWAFDLPEAVEISLVALAVSPVPPILPRSRSRRMAKPPTRSGCRSAPPRLQPCSFRLPSNWSA